MIDSKLIYAESENMGTDTVGSHDSSVLVHGDGSSSAGVADGNPMDLTILINEAVLSGGASTVQFELMHRDPGGAFETTGIKTAAIPVADLVAGKDVFFGPIPSGVKDETKIVRTIGTADLTAGKYTAYLNVR